MAKQGGIPGWEGQPVKGSMARGPSDAQRKRWKEPGPREFYRTGVHGWDFDV